MGVTRAATFEFSGVKSPMSKQIRSLSTLYCYVKTKSAAIVEALIKKDVLKKSVGFEDMFCLHLAV